MARKRKAPRPFDNKSTISPTLLQYSNEAGAGGYLWRDAALQERLDPKGVYRTASVGISTGIATVALIALLVASIAHGAATAVLALLALLAGVFAGYWGMFKDNLRGNVANSSSPLGHLRLIPWWSWALLGYSAAPTIFDGAVLTMTVPLLAAAMFLAPPRTRGPAVAYAAFAGALLSATLPATLGEQRPWIGAFVALSVLVGALYVMGLRTIPNPLRRVKESDLRTVVPPPPSTLPWLMHLVPSLRGEIASPPWDISRKTIGAVGERRMGVLLLALKRWKGTRIGHDLLIPGAAQANIDHLVIARSGIYVIDAKQFGSKGDPGAITQDAQGQIVHRTMQGSRSIEQSLSTAAWAAQQVEATLEVSGVRAILAVFTATIPANMVVRRNGRDIEIVSAWALPGIIDRESAPSHPGYGKALILRSRMRSASTKGRARFVAPRGASSGAMEHISRTRSETTSGVEAVLPPLSMPPLVAPTRPVTPVTPVAFIPEPETFEEPRPAITAKPRTITPATPPAGTPVPTQSPAPRQSPVLPSLEDRLREVLDERWRQMDLSDPAAPDEIAVELRGLRRGERLTLVEFSESTSTPTSREVVAMSGPCRGAHGTYIWYCAPEQYAIHEASGRRVNVATISTEKVMRRGEK